MKFIDTAGLDEKVLHDFFEEKWSQFEEKQSLKQYGYLVEHEGTYKAYFALSPVKSNGLWLKSLYMKEGVPATFPLAILESAIALAKEKEGESLFVYSHQTTLDTLLQMIHFKRVDTPAFAEELLENRGSWWKIEVK
ncbi:hypothetical protein KO561_17485 [Radiobacillus kanasensis]|uniref:hypothetical protein n=1 Tax=Radiobacillus kanasensis TaxID=2844358 RepID=UPI001E61476E|nr:hypothetical protein [Radiobacillus kanasensis]UFT98959.1 hypothetical protein KO561_17485 [Radiobacillus kanasensis]